MYNVLRQRNKQNTGIYLADLCFHCFTIMLRVVMYTQLTTFVCLTMDYSHKQNKNECRCSQGSDS